MAIFGGKGSASSMKHVDVIFAWVRFVWGFDGYCTQYETGFAMGNPTTQPNPLFLVREKKHELLPSEKEFWRGRSHTIANLHEMTIWLFFQRIIHMLTQEGFVGIVLCSTKRFWFHPLTRWFSIWEWLFIQIDDILMAVLPNGWRKQQGHAPTLGVL